MSQKVAMIMAGGAGSRMYQSGSTLPKPLVKVAGVELLERNLHQLVRCNFKNIVISVAEEASEIRMFVHERLIPLAKILNISLRETVEVESKGNLGAAGDLSPEYPNLLVVFADNLTTLNLDEVWQKHLEMSSDLTLTSHLERFQIPYGELKFGDSQSNVVDYVEKPVYEIPVSSAITVIGDWALKELTTKTSYGLSELSISAIQAGKNVRAFHHQAPWIDVNDMNSIADAEQLVQNNFDHFENWCPDRARTITLNIDSIGNQLENVSNFDQKIVNIPDLDEGEMLRVILSAHDGSTHIDERKQQSLLPLILGRLRKIHVAETVSVSSQKIS